MEYIGRIRGSAEQAKPIVIGFDTVYVHTDIKKLENQEFDEYEYNEIQYEKDEYIQLMAEKIPQMEKQVDDTQLALCEVYEAIGK